MSFDLLTRAPMGTPRPSTSSLVWHLAFTPISIGPKLCYLINGRVQIAKGEERRKAAPQLCRPKQPDVAGAGGMPSPAAAPNTGFPGTNNAFAGKWIIGHGMGHSTLPV